jgi:glyoxylase-like metal-dependent hydrolase (beta-lactamase superfamily II)
MKLLETRGPLVFGRWRVTRILEWEGEAFPYTTLFPGKTLEEVQSASPAGMDSRLSPDGALISTTQFFLLQSGERNLLVEQGSGNGKVRPNDPYWDHQSLPYLDTLASLGVRREDVAAVYLSHLHPDHVGLATTDRGGRWEPTFPRAEYVLHAREWEFWKPIYERDPVHNPWIGDSVLPLVDSGRVHWAADGDGIHGLRVHEAFGHTPGHCLFEAEGAGLWFLGDLFHHPAQVAHPEWPSGNFDSDPEANYRTRIESFRRFAKSGAALLAVHPGGPFRIESRSDGDFVFQADGELSRRRNE